MKQKINHSRNIQTFMRYAFVLFLLLFNFNSFTMQSDVDVVRKQILALAKSRIRQHVNQELLEISRQARLIKDKQLIEEFKNYYYFGQPKNQVNEWAYLKKPLVNTKKMFEYLPLLHPSYYHRRKELWPLMSLPYELKEIACQLGHLHKSAYEALHYWNQQSHPQAVRELQAISDDELAVRRAISICEQSVETEKQS